MFGLLAALVLVAAPSAPPATIAVAPGRIAGVAQSNRNVAWLESSGSSCRLRVRSVTGGPTRAFPSLRGSCPEDDLMLAGGRAAWGGYVEVRCSEFTAVVDATVNGHSRRVDQIDGDCLGYRTSFRGLASDGTSFFYSLLDTKPPGDDSLQCGEGGACLWRLAGGRVVRIAGTRPVTVRGLPPAALLAGANGRLTLVEPSRSGSASRSDNGFDWPRAARNGKVEIRNSSTTALESSFRPRGTVRAVALSANRAVVLVASDAGLRTEWYDADAGARLGSVAVPRSTAHRLSTDGHYVAFAAGKTVRVLDLTTGAQRIVRRPQEPVGLSVRAGRLVWGENGSRGGRILTIAA